MENSETWRGRLERFLADLMRQEDKVNELREELEEAEDGLDVYLDDVRRSRELVSVFDTAKDDMKDEIDELRESLEEAEEERLRLYDKLRDAESSAERVFSSREWSEWCDFRHDREFRSYESEAEDEDPYGIEEELERIRRRDRKESRKEFFRFVNASHAPIGVWAECEGFEAELEAAVKDGLVLPSLFAHEAAALLGRAASDHGDKSYFSRLFEEVKSLAAIEEAEKRFPKEFIEDLFEGADGDDEDDEDEDEEEDEGEEDGLF